MRKRELVHLHALFDRVRRFMRDRGELDDERFEAYEQLDVGSTEIYRSKSDHERAVSALSRSLADATGDEAPDAESENRHASAHGD